MATKVVEDTEHGKHFPELQDGEMLAITSKDLQRDYAFHRLGRTVETWMVDQKLGCPDTWDREEAIGTEVSARAQQVTLAGETSLYSLNAGSWRCSWLQIGTHTHVSRIYQFGYMRTNYIEVHDS